MDHMAHMKAYAKNEATGERSVFDADCSGMFTCFFPHISSTSLTNYDELLYLIIVFPECA